MQQQYSMAHYTGVFFKAFAVFAVFLLSAGLSYMFFATISPPDKPWFPYAAMGLTEGGFALWLAVFLLMKHDAFNKATALLMVVACAIASFIVAGTELHILFTDATGIANSASVYNFVQVVLEVMFAMHLSIAIVDVLHGYFSKPGNSFFNSQPGNLIPMQGNYSIEELQALNTTIAGYIDAARNGGETANPLDSMTPQPQYTPVSLPNIGQIVSGAVSSLTRKGKGSKRNTSQAGRVPGQTSETTGENTSNNDESSNE